jgi:hypothetical protein
MQKVESSSLFSRFTESPANAGLLSFLSTSERAQLKLGI